MGNKPVRLAIKLDQSRWTAGDYVTGKVCMEASSGSDLRHVAGINLVLEGQERVEMEAVRQVTVVEGLDGSSREPLREDRSRVVVDTDCATSGAPDGHWRNQKAEGNNNRRVRWQEVGPANTNSRQSRVETRAAPVGRREHSTGRVESSVRVDSTSVPTNRQSAVSPSSDARSRSSQTRAESRTNRGQQVSASRQVEATVRGGNGASAQVVQSESSNARGSTSRTAARSNPRSTSSTVAVQVSDSHRGRRPSTSENRSNQVSTRDGGHQVSVPTVERSRRGRGEARAAATERRERDRRVRSHNRATRVEQRRPQAGNRSGRSLTVVNGNRAGTTTQLQRYRARTNHTFVKTDFLLVSFSNRLAQGQYEYPFRWRLPAESPSTMYYKEGKNTAEIVYSVTAYVVKESGGKSEQVTTDFVVMALPPRQRDRVVMGEEIYPIHSCCFNKGTIDLGWSTSSANISAGRPVSIDITGQNNSRKSVDYFSTSLLQAVEFRDGSGKTYKSQRSLIKHNRSTREAIQWQRLTRRTQLQDNDYHALEGSSSGRMSLDTTLRVPNDALDSYMGRLIQIRHTLQVTAHMAGCCSSNPDSACQVHVVPAQEHDAPSVATVHAQVLPDDWDPVEAEVVVLPEATEVKADEPLFGPPSTSSSVVPTAPHESIV